MVLQYTALLVLPEAYLDSLHTHTHTLYVFSASPHQQDYRWWWRTFLVSGGSAFYVLIYAIFYFVNKVSPEAVSDIHNKLWFHCSQKFAATELNVFN